MAKEKKEKMKARHIVNADGIHHHAETDVIEYEGKFWLVPEWIDNHTMRLTKPMRIIGLEKLRHHRMEDGNFLVEDTIPKSVLDGQIPPGEAHKYVVLEFPDISFPILPRTH